MHTRASRSSKNVSIKMIFHYVQNLYSHLN
ncbi:LANO_0F10396g1_1 [Lachancea nothofagi CBS 11611]|uniref:LANO_0F10396g1_1 n=1 Tax=Lachancea nothofagi CBS 11611 TaxID=1266666 RepID=A0A1G4KAD6_9SACH|nr:LANO_0F10396g1_1 [Lachancea nothofagi CBS 11611]